MPLDLPFDPIKRSKEVESLVMRGDQRLYYRFRSPAHYGGIATADTTGCNLLCAYCWNYHKNMSPCRGVFCTPADVIAKLKAESVRSGYKLFRVCGAEPILGTRSARHLAEVLSAFPRRFIVETNGIMLGFDPGLLDLLLPHQPYIRLSIKGDSPERFEEITGADAAAFRYQLRARKELRKRGAKYGIAAMAGAVDPGRLARLFPGEEIEWEDFRDYFGKTMRYLASRGVRLDRDS